MPRRTDEQRRSENRGRSDRNPPPGISGYIGPGGKPLANTGSDDAPYGHLPPFPTPVERLIHATPPLLGQNTSFDASDEIDVEWERTLSVFVRYQPLNHNAALVLVCQVLDERAGAWFPLAIRNPTVTAASDPVGAGAQTLYASRLESPAIVAGTVYRVAVSFDIGPYRKARMLYAETGAQASGGTVILDIVTSQ